MPKTKKSTKPNAAVVSVKSKFKTKSTLFSLVVVLIIIAVGYGGYIAWQQHNHNKLSNGLKAHAANYGALIGNSANLSARACQKRYSTSQPDELWVLVSKKSRASGLYIKDFIAVSVPGHRAIEQSSDGWWGGSIQLFKIPVGRANINNNAYLSGAPSYYRGQNYMDLRVFPTTGGNGIVYLSVSAAGNESLTSAYAGSRATAKTYSGTFNLPLIKGLPVCDY
jgi:hypothetical protein